MSRSGRIFGPRNSRRSWRDFAVYDFEWVPGSLQFRLAAAYDGREYRAYHSVAAFLDGELIPSRSGLWYYAHAGGLADFNFILPELVRRGEYSARGATSGSSVICATIKRGRYCWHLLDSYWLLRDSLANIGKWTGVRKADPWKRLCNESCEKECKRHAREWYAEAPLDELTRYNRQDCIVLYEGIERFQSTLLELGGSLKRTQAACGMDLFRRKYLTREIHTSSPLNHVAREAYTASRVEVIASDCAQANYYDINSSFPYAMTFAQPGSLSGSYERLPDRLMYDADSTPFLADVTLSIPDVYLPPLPYRRAGKVFFPSGKWRSWMSSVDLELAMQEGAKIYRIHEVLEFEPFYDLANYANDLYNRRAASSDPFERVAYKLLLNSVYGKFGERGIKQCIWINPPLSALQRMNRETDYRIPGVWVETTERAVPHEHVPISVHITALARRTLYRHITSVVDVFYCDTDGFATSDELPTSPLLGGLKLEKVLTRGRFVAPKLYDMEGIIDGEPKRVQRAKGFSIGNDAEKFEALLSGLSVEIERMQRVRESINPHLKKHDPLLMPRENVVEKRLHRNVTKRFTYPDGSTRPWHITELKRL